MQDLWEKEYFYGGFSLNGLAFLLYLSKLYDVWFEALTALQFKLKKMLRKID